MKRLPGLHVSNLGFLAVKTIDVKNTFLRFYSRHVLRF